jgi:hypothetical protein
MSIAHRDVILQLIREYQALNTPNIEYRNSSPAALEFSRILNSNRPVVFKSADPFLIVAHRSRFNNALACASEMARSPLSAFGDGGSISNRRRDPRWVLIDLREQ